MRERISLGVTVAALVVLVTLSAVFARSRKPSTGAPPSGVPQPAATLPSEPAGVGDPTARAGEPPSPEEPATGAPAAAPTAADSTRGHAVFASKGCLRCHSVAGEGNARNPLDGVGARRTSAELRAWTIGAEVLADSLPPSAFRAKQAFQQMPAEELDPLITYLSSLASAPKPE